MLRVEVVGHDTIKPTSPTPPHLNTHNLSWLDRMSPPLSVNLILFYPNAAAAEKLIPILKKSLSETLTIFYPLAGRLDPRNTSTVDCNDEGVDLFLARAVTDASLSQLLDRGIKQDQLIHLLPPKESDTTPLLSLQVTVFPACSGMAIGVCVLHTLADGHSIANFITTWAETARDNIGNRVSLPSFDAASRFGAPSRDFHSAPLSASKEKLQTRSFVFEQSAIDTLTIPPKYRPKPTRAVAVSALLWRCFMRTQLRAGASVAVFAANMRGKGGDLPDHLFGNLCAFVAASEIIDGDDTMGTGEKFRTEDKLSSATRKMASKWINRILGPDGPSVVSEKFDEAEKEVGEYEEVERYYFSSWLRFPLYEADFGWGKPAWVGLAGMPIKNAVVLMGRGEKGGMEVWVILGEDDMKEFERDEELMCYCTAYI